MTRFEARSLRPGEVRLADFLPLADDVVAIAVTALDKDGIVVTGSVEFALKWASTGWQRQFACPICLLPCRTIGIHDGFFACQRCMPRRTAHQRRKNQSNWVGNDAVVDRIVRALTKLGSANRQPQCIKAATRQLASRSISMVDALLSSVVHICKELDNVIEEDLSNFIPDTP